MSTGPVGPFPEFAPKPGETPAALSSSAPFQIEYLRAYNFIFENPNWMTNVMWGSLAFMVPVVGPLVFMGYQYETVEALYLSRGARYPDFNTDKLGDYLGRAVWPFLVNLIVQMPVGLVMVVAYLLSYGLTFGAAFAGGRDFGAILAVVVGILCLMGLIALWMVAFLFIIPMTLKAGLAQDFGAGFDMKWVMDFIKKTWVETILTTLFMMFSGFILVLIGELACCVGVLPAMAVMMLAQTFMWYQLYALYLSRGGTPIPFKQQLPPAVMQTYVPPPQY